MTISTANKQLDKTTALILAAGQGTRMQSETSKVLHEIAGRPLIYYSIRAALDAGCKDVVVVVGHAKEQVARYVVEMFGEQVRMAVQSIQKGTGDAAAAGLAAVDGDNKNIVVFYGDAPLIVADNIRAVTLALEAAPSSLHLATCTLDDPTGYGRIIRNSTSSIVAIREQRDLRSSEEANIREINPGIYAASLEFFRAALASLKPTNAQGELYLTDIVTFAVANHQPVVSISLPTDVLLGVNDRVQLADAEGKMFSRIANHWRRFGATISTGAMIDDAVRIGRDCVIGPGVILRGETVIGSQVRIDVGCVVTNTKIGDASLLKPYTVIGNSIVDKYAQLGPFSHIRPDTNIGEGAHIGNFVETKKTTMGAGSKANHLAYLGDGIVGERTNIGAGTIFCNYDGTRKHLTTIESDVFIGSDSQIVAPVRIGAGAYVATGTTVVKDVPADALAIGRVRQENKEGYAERIRQRNRSAKGSSGAQGQ